jgi:hypothetical protein
VVSWKQEVGTLRILALAGMGPVANLLYLISYNKLFLRFFIYTSLMFAD